MTQILTNIFFGLLIIYLGSRLIRSLWLTAKNIDLITNQAEFLWFYKKPILRASAELDNIWTWPAKEVLAWVKSKKKKKE